MRLIFFLFISFIAHALTLLYAQIPVQIQPKLNAHSPPLQVLMTKKLLEKRSEFDENKKPNPLAKKLSPILAANKSEIIQLNAQDEIESIATSEFAITQENSLETVNKAEATKVDISNYYAIENVDRKALPQLNIDESKIKSSTYSGLPIKLRLFINARGQLVKIVQIAALDQDKEYIAQLEKLLFELVFMPAKKDSMDVDSYQDVQFSFNPLPHLDSAANTE